MVVVFCVAWVSLGFTGNDILMPVATGSCFCSFRGSDCLNWWCKCRKKLGPERYAVDFTLFCLYSFDLMRVVY